MTGPDRTPASDLWGGVAAAEAARRSVTRSPMQPNLPEAPHHRRNLAPVHRHPNTPAQRRARLAARLTLAAALILPLGTAVAAADATVDAGTTPTATTPFDPSSTPAASPSPTATPTPAATPTPSPSPTPIPTPAITAPSISGAATKAVVTWTGPATISEEKSFQLKVAGTIDGQATAHIAVLDASAACPASPLYPTQLATGTRLTVTPNPGATPVYATATGAPSSAPATTPVVLGGQTSATLTTTARDSGTYRLCGWLVGSPAFGTASTISQYDQIVAVGNRPGTVSATIPDTARSADYFTVKATGTTDGTGRRLLVMGEPDKGQSCDAMRKLPTGKRPLQTVVSVSGSFTKTIKVRFASKTSGAQLVCVQLVEVTDRIPEASASHTITVSEALKCTTTQAAINQTVSDLKVIRGRRDAALSRLSAAKKKLAPLRARVSKQKKRSAKRIATARKAAARAKSAAGRKKAKAHLAAVKKSEAKRIYRAGSGLRAMTGTIKGHQRTYSQYRTGANLLADTLARTRKDLKKYCSPAGRSIA